MLAFCARTKSPFMQPGYRDKSPARALPKEKAQTRTLPLPWACTGVVFRERHLEASGDCVSHSAAPGTPLLEELHPQQLPAPRQHRWNQGEGLGLGARSLPRCRRRAAPSSYFSALCYRRILPGVRQSPFTSGPLLPLEMKALGGKRSFLLPQGPNTQLPALPGPDPAAAGSTAPLPAARPRRRNGG